MDLFLVRVQPRCLPPCALRIAWCSTPTGTYLSQCTKGITFFRCPSFTVVAGTGIQGYGGDGGPASSTMLNMPIALALNVEGDIFFSDVGTFRIRRISAWTGRITTVVGTGTEGYNGDNRLGLTALLRFVVGLAFDAQGNMVFSDRNRIRKARSLCGLLALYPLTGGDADDRSGNARHAFGSGGASLSSSGVRLTNIGDALVIPSAAASSMTIALQYTGGTNPSNSSDPIVPLRARMAGIITIS